MQHSVHHISRKARWFSRRIMMVATGVVLLSIGGGFLVAAIWMALAAEFSPLIATFACAAIFLGVGIIILAISKSEPEPVMPSTSEQLRAQAAHEPPRPPQGEFPALMEAFLFGISTYSRIRNQRK